MYYINTNKTELEQYNQRVVEGENYGDSTISWSNVIKKFDEELYAISAHPKYLESLNTLEILEDWEAPEVELLEE